MPHIVSCFASLLVSRIRLELSPYLGSTRGSHTLFTRVHLLVTPMNQQLSPRLDPTPHAHLSMCVGPWPETCHDRCYATHLFSFQRRAPTNLATIFTSEVLPSSASMSSPVHAGQPASNQPTALKRTCYSLLKSLNRSSDTPSLPPLSRKTKQTIKPASKKLSREDCFLSTDKDAFHRQSSEESTVWCQKHLPVTTCIMMSKPIT
jgi:hypothetical protein